MIEIKNLSKEFQTTDRVLHALKDVSLTVEDGDIFGIIGMSGAGKSTLVRCINMLEKPTGGSVLIDGVDMGSLSEKELRAARKDITMIFQGFNLLMQKNCLKNVCFPLELAGVPKREAKKKAMELLETVGLANKAKAYPAQLSGGQQQRIAIARALATNPKILLCDEATSALDPTTTNSILELIRDINEKTGITVVIITHQMSVVEQICKHVAIIEKGVVVETGDVVDVFTSPKSAAAKQLVFPEGASDIHIAENSSQKYVRVIFNGAQTTSSPIISRMAIDLGIEVSISYASTRNIGGKTYGSMVLGVCGDEKMLADTIEYFNKLDGIIAKEVEDNV